MTFLGQRSKVKVTAGCLRGEVIQVDAIVEVLLLVLMLSVNACTFYANV